MSFRKGPKRCPTVLVMTMRCYEAIQTKWKRLEFVCVFCYKIGGDWDRQCNIPNVFLGKVFVKQSPYMLHLKPHLAPCLFFWIMCVLIGITALLELETQEF